MNTTSTGELTPDEVTLLKFENAPRKESASTYQFNAGGRNGTHSTKAEEEQPKKEQAKNRKEQVLEKLRSSTLPSDAFMNAPSGRWHIKDMFYVGQVGVMVGMWKSGKTFSAIHLAFRIAWGLPLMQPVTQDNEPAKPLGEVRLSGNVLYIPSEGAGGLKDRIKGYRQFYNQERTEGAGDVLVYPHAFDVFSEPDLQALSEFCTERKIVFIVVDTLASNLAGLIQRGHSNPENDSGAMSLMFDNLQKVCSEQEHGCSGLFLHHPAKPSGGTESTDARGSGGIEASARFKLTIKVDKEGQNRTLALGFNNDADDSKAPIIPFRLENVCVGITEDGDRKEVGVFKCGGVRKSSKPDSRMTQMFSAYCVTMDFNSVVDRKDWEACVKTNHPDISADNFRFYLNKLLNDGYIQEFPFKKFPKEEQARRNKKVKYYELTKLGMENQPINGDPENTKRPWGWTAKKEAWFQERPDDAPRDSEAFKEWEKREPADYV